MVFLFLARYPFLRGGLKCTTNQLAVVYNDIGCLFRRHGRSDEWMRG